LEPPGNRTRSHDGRGWPSSGWAGPSGTMLNGDAMGEPSIAFIVRVTTYRNNPPGGLTVG